MMMIQLIVMLNYLLMMIVMIRVWFYVIDSHIWRKKSIIAGLNCIKEDEVLSMYHNNWIMSCACHESFTFWSCVVILWSDRTGTHLASYVARGGVRCGFIPSEVWRQKLHTLHSYAFIEVIAGAVDKMKWLYNLM